MARPADDFGAFDEYADPVDDAYAAEVIQDAENDRADRFADDLSELREQGIDADAAIAEIVNREVGIDMAMFSDYVVEHGGREVNYGDFESELTDDYTRLAKTVARDIAFELRQRRRLQPVRSRPPAGRAPRRACNARHQGSRRTTSRSSGGGSSGSDDDGSGSEPPPRLRSGRPLGSDHFQIGAGS